ncbi:hypothetical protein [Legionella bononiensis]|uniref:Capsule polysaccharide biosynthesis protein n=1 Tax=Legionella bononiensis TaxID=2793102 RepID=A0ABS1W7W4_9GAMM|nr:hypothetical protein [Legionella bononiensis]MBL7480028.1 hypothetical protein [Legionella bononiensis]MBL7525458.1 hypothetical protein [Legionella bononiensis]MBL7561641.1 hypothetical protein [Legionella bononiensis]
MIKQEFYLFIDIHPQHIEAINQWISGKNGKTAILVPSHSELSTGAFNAELFTEKMLITTNSEIEELCYKTVENHKLFQENYYKKYKFNGVPLIKDFYNNFDVSSKNLFILSVAARMLYDKGYDNVVVVLQHYSIWHLFLLDEAKSIALSSEDATPYTVNESNEIISCPKHQDIFLQTSRKCTNFELAGLVWHLYCGQGFEYDELMKGNLAKIRWDIFLRFIDQLKLSTKNLVSKMLQKFKSLKTRDNSQNPNRILCLITSQEPLYYKNILPISRALNSSNAEVSFYTLNKEQAGFYQNNIKANSLTADAMDYTDWSLVMFFGVLSLIKLFQAIQTAENQNPEQSTNTLGMSSNTLFFIDRSIINRYGFQKGIILIRNIKRIKKIFDDVNPTVVYKVPSTHILHHVIKVFTERRKLKLVTSIFASINEASRNWEEVAPCDIYTVLGYEQVNSFINKGLSSSHVYPVGQPELDVYIEDWNEDKCYEYVIEKIGAIDRNKRIILIATSNFDVESEKQWIPRVAQICSQMGLQLLIKLHPSMNVSQFKLNITSAHDYIICPEMDLIPIIKLAAIILTDVSHAGKLSVYFGKRLLIVNLSEQPFPYNRLDEEGVALLAKDLESIEDKIKELLSHQVSEEYSLFRSKFISHNFTSDKEPASKSIVKLLCNSL